MVSRLSIILVFLLAGVWAAFDNLPLMDRENEPVNLLKQETPITGVKTAETIHKNPPVSSVTRNNKEPSYAIYTNHSFELLLSNLIVCFRRTPEKDH